MNAEKNDKLVDKRGLIGEHTKDIREAMPVYHCGLDEKYRKCSLDDRKVEIQESLDDRGKKAVGWMDDEEKSLMDLGISEVERTKRLENLMERRRSRTLSKFHIIRNAMGVGVGSNSCGQISSLHIPKKNPFLFKSSGDLPGSAPTYMIKNNPFDLPYDPHEEKPILTGDSFEDEFVAAHQKKTVFCRRESSSLGDLATPESNVVTDISLAIEGGESSEKLVNVADHSEDHEVDHIKDHDIDRTKEYEVDHDVVSSDQSTSSSEDEPILRPNKEAILHCLSMSRMRVISQGNSFRRNAESFDCGPSALFDKSKTDCFFFGSNKRIHYGSTNSVASDMQVEVSELDSPRSTNLSSLDEEGKVSLVNSTNPSEMDLNEVRLRDIDESSEQDTTEPGFSQRALDPDRFDSTIKPEKSSEQGEH